MADDAQDRNLPASQRKIKKAREDGQVPRSRDLGHLAVIGLGAAVLMAAMPMLLQRARAILDAGLRFDSRALSQPDAMQQALAQLALQLLWLVLPLGAVGLLAALAAGLLSGGWNLTFKPLKPKFGKLNPLTGLPRLLSVNNLVESLKACLLAAILLSVGGLYLRSHLAEFVQLSAQPLPNALVDWGSLIRGGVLLLLLALGVFAIVDVPLQRWRLGRQLKMSHREVKQEHKESEGNAEVKGRMRQLMRQMSRNRMLAAVPAADLVVMNPTHYAVALKYDEATMAAPKVVAKGTDLLALRIRDIAAENKVPVLEAPPLARALYAHSEVDREVPAVLFGAVAQVLDWVYQLRAAAAATGPAAVRAARALPRAPNPQVAPELDPHDKQFQRPNRRRQR
jgi:flagellar biosynthetic protein FlhB